MAKSTKQYLVCAFLLVVGLALCIGGIFLAPLLIAGVPMFTGGLGLLAAIIEDKDKIAINTTINNFRGRSPNNAANNTDVEAAVDTVVARARYGFNEAGKNAINSWANRIRGTFIKAPSNLTLVDPPVVTFSNNYHLPHDANNLPQQDVSDRSADYVTAESEDLEEKSSRNSLSITQV